MHIPLLTVDAFIDPNAAGFSGNPAAVCLLPHPLGEREMQDVAFEINLSETAFLHGSEGNYSLRWFTPAAEVELCGHATLASTHVIWENEPKLMNSELKFQKKSGVLLIKIKKNVFGCRERPGQL